MKSARISAEISRERYQIPKQVLSTWESDWVDGHHLEQNSLRYGVRIQGKAS